MPQCTNQVHASAYAPAYAQPHAEWHAEPYARTHATKHAVLDLLDLSTTGVGVHPQVCTRQRVHPAASAAVLFLRTAGPASAPALARRPADKRQCR